MFSKISNDFSGNVDSLLDSFNNNKILFTIVSVLLSLYAGMIAPKLPKSIALLIDNFYVKLLLIFIIAYISSHNPLLSLLISLAILLSMQALITLENNNNTLNIMQKVSVPSTNNIDNTDTLLVNNDYQVNNNIEFPSANDSDNVYSSINTTTLNMQDQTKNTDEQQQQNIVSYSGPDYANY